MCAGCGGSCSSSAPNFSTTQNVGPPEMRILGTHGAPTAAPTHLIRQAADVATYETLYSGLTPAGEPALMVAAGTFASLHSAGRYR
ncbi:hypothetical protein [Kitasatospora sp. NPDC057198]|uniref:hypothetical protein n=1 Tax=Kitasatospora sp. NPDC057198 TaxID=3346046 RepID=UPI00362526E4